MNSITLIDILDKMWYNIKWVISDNPVPPTFVPWLSAPRQAGAGTAGIFSE